MTFTAITGDIPIQPGAGALLFRASGAITKGQAVVIVQPSSSTEIAVHDYVGVPNESGSCLVGVAAYTVAHNDPVAIYGPGNWVKAKLSGTACTYGTLVGYTNDGMIRNTVLSTYKRAIVTKGVASTGDGEILIF